MVTLNILKKKKKKHTNYILRYLNFKPKCKVIYGKCLSGMLFRTNVSVSPFITRELHNLIEGWEHKYVIVHLH